MACMLSGVPHTPVSECVSVSCEWVLLSGTDRAMGIECALTAKPCVRVTRYAKLRYKTPQQPLALPLWS